MKTIDKLKKDKSPTVKLIHPLKKTESKKTINKKEETTLPKSTTINTQHSASPMETPRSPPESTQAPNPPKSSTPQSPAIKTRPKPV